MNQCDAGTVIGRLHFAPADETSSDFSNSTRWVCGSETTRAVVVVLYIGKYNGHASFACAHCIYSTFCPLEQSQQPLYYHIHVAHATIAVYYGVLLSYQAENDADVYDPLDVLDAPDTVQLFQLYADITDLSGLSRRSLGSLDQVLFPDVKEGLLKLQKIYNKNVEAVPQQAPDEETVSFADKRGYSRSDDALALPRTQAVSKLSWTKVDDGSKVKIVVSAKCAPMSVW